MDVFAKQTRLVDTRTGEVVKEGVTHFPAYFDEEKGYLLWPRKNFAKQFADIDFPKDMSMLDRGRMATLAKRIWSNTNMLGYRSHGQLRPYDVDGIGEAIELSPRYAREWVDKMVDLGVLARVDVTLCGNTETQYYVNPIYFCSSTRIPLNLYLIFRKSLDLHLPAWVKARYAQQMTPEQKKVV